MSTINLNPWQYAYVQQLAEEATILARQEGLRPTLATDLVRTYPRTHRLNIPNLGNYVPEGWTRVDHLIEPVFVDSTGLTRPNSNAITPFVFFKRASIQQHLSFVIGYGVVETGQTQVLVATFRKEA